jgi:nicotinate-nucleotide adenylyltransferase
LFDSTFYLLRFSDFLCNLYSITHSLVVSFFMIKRKIALFGGTFDPVHLGHTIVANDAVEHIGAEKIIFIPAKRSPLKGFSPMASDIDRFEMTTLAIAEENKFEVSDYELIRAAPSYTIDTVKKFQADYGDDTLIYWLIGADSIGDLEHWHRIADLIDICNITTMYRAGFNLPDFSRFEVLWGKKRIEKLQRNVVETSLIDISSTEIRNRLAAGRDATGMLHPAVADYIRKHNLYRTQTES